ncbi:MAG: hypothetical protein ACN6O8_19130 [Achromobacter sp.]|uniref:hypothetical protein n=1 Tax=Achromobacter sp. TaxID=134375 RepID=UPI003D08D322
MFHAAASRHVTALTPVPVAVSDGMPEVTPGAAADALPDAVAGAILSGRTGGVSGAALGAMFGAVAGAGWPDAIDTWAGRAASATACSKAAKVFSRGLVLPRKGIDTFRVALRSDVGRSDGGDPSVCNR